VKTNIKKMKKITLLAFVVTVSYSAFSQSGKFSGGVELSLPTGIASEVIGLGLGLSGRYEAAIQDKLNWFATAGFVTYGGKDLQGLQFNPVTQQLETVTISGSSSTLIALQGGAKYYFQESDNGFYGSGELGLFIGTGSGSSSKFGFSPGIGYRLEKFDLSFRYNLVSDFNNLGVRAAYIF
jgi:hypothetical protein